MVTAKIAAHNGALLLSLILMLLQEATATIEIPLELLRVINAPLLQAAVSAHSDFEQPGISDESHNHRRHAALAYSKGKDTMEATDELKPLNVNYGNTVSKNKNGKEKSPIAGNIDEDSAYLEEVVDDEELIVPANNNNREQTRKVFILPGGESQTSQLPEWLSEERQQTPYHVSQNQQRTHNQYILANQPASLATKEGHRSLQHKLTKQKQVSGRHCAIEISTQLEGQCQPMGVVGGFACVSGDYMDVFNADCM